MKPAGLSGAHSPLQPQAAEGLQAADAIAHGGDINQTGPVGGALHAKQVTLPREVP